MGIQKEIVPPLKTGYLCKFENQGKRGDSQHHFIVILHRK